MEGIRSLGDRVLGLFGSIMRIIAPALRPVVGRVLMGFMGLALAASAQAAGQGATASSEPKPALQVEIQVSSREGLFKETNGVVQFIPAPSVAGVRIEVCEYPIRSEVRVLAAYATDEQGKASIVVPPEGCERASNGQVSTAIRVNHEGFQTRYTKQLNPKRDDPFGMYATGFRLIEGRSILGYVSGLNEIPDAFNVVYRSGGPDVVVTPIIQRPSYCSARHPFPPEGFVHLGPGVFVFHYTKSRTVDFLATVEGQGTAAIHGVDLSLDSPPESVRLHIAGPGVLQGQIVDTEGRPRPSVSVLCSHASGEEAHARTGWNCENWSSRTPGILMSGISTDRQGRFKFSGLRAGSYRLSIDPGCNRSSALRSDYFGLLHESDGREIKLVIAQGKIQVNLIDLDGNPVLSRRYFTSGPYVPGPVVAISKRIDTPWGQEFSPSGYLHYNARTGQATAAVQAGQTHWVHIQGDGFEDAQIPVPVDGNGVSTPITVQAKSHPSEEPLETGTIQVKVVDEWGDPLGPMDDCWLTIESTQGSIPFPIDTDPTVLRSSAGPVVHELPVGRYKLVIKGAVGKYIVGSVYHPIRLGRTERFIQVEKGSNKTYELVLERAGQLLVLLDGSPTDSDKLVAKFDRLSSPNSTWGPGLFENRANAYPWEPESIAKLTLYKKGIPPIPVVHVVSGNYRMNSRCDRWPLNQRIRSDFIPAGDYVLVAELAAGRRVEKKVTVTAGKIQGVRMVIP